MQWHGQALLPCAPFAHPAHAEALEVAQELIGSPYRYGGEDPGSGFDCSGLVYYTHRRAGIVLPRTTRQQFSATYPVSRKLLTPGDLVFFRIGRRGKISHVGLYLGDDAFIHAPSRGKTVQISELSNPYWDKRFIRGGRIPGVRDARIQSARFYTQK